MKLFFGSKALFKKILDENRNSFQKEVKRFEIYLNCEEHTGTT